MSSGCAGHSLYSCAHDPLLLEFLVFVLWFLEAWPISAARTYGNMLDVSMSVACGRESNVMQGDWWSATWLG